MVRAQIYIFKMQIRKLFSQEAWPDLGQIPTLVDKEGEKGRSWTLGWEVSQRKACGQEDMEKKISVSLSHVFFCV